MPPALLSLLWIMAQQSMPFKMCVHTQCFLCVCYIVPSTHHGHLQPSAPPLCGYRGCQAGSTSPPPHDRLLAQHGTAATEVHGAGCVLSGPPLLFPLQGENAPQCSVLVQPWVTLSSEDQHPLWGVVTPERGYYCRKSPESPVDGRPLEPVTRCMVQVDWGWSGSRCIWVVYGPLTLLGGQMQSQPSGKKVTRPWPGVPYTTLSSFCTYTHFSHKGFQVACNTRHIK